MSTDLRGVLSVSERTRYEKPTPTPIRKDSACGHEGDDGVRGVLVEVLAAVVSGRLALRWGRRSWMGRLSGTVVDAGAR